MNNQYAGLYGLYGYSLDKDYNKLVDKANELVREYNSKVYTYKTAKEQFDYQTKILAKIDLIYKGEVTDTTQEDLKLLAEWDGVKLRGEGVFLHTDDPKHQYWQPHTDSNQLDMLENKMIEELADDLFYIETYCGADEYVIRGYNFDKTKMIVSGYGSTKNEARLNAILNYIKKKKDT